MGSSIDERLSLKRIEAYAPKYEEFINAITENPSMKLIQLYESAIEKGIFIEVEVFISIPTKGVYKNLDIREKEKILFFLKTEYPLFAPAVMVMRDNFPYEFIPHLNRGISGSKINELNLCLYRGDIDEWFYSYGAMSFCDLVNEWFSDLVNGDLIKDDGFECIRIKNTEGIMVADYALFENEIACDGRDKGHYILNANVSLNNLIYIYVSNEKYAVGKDCIPCLLVFDKRVNSEYVSENYQTASDLSGFYSYQGLKHAIQKYRNKFYDPKTKNKLLDDGILFVLAVHRPQQVIGSFGKIEFLAFYLEFDFEHNPPLDKCPIKGLATIQSLNVQMAEKLSGTTFKKSAITILGCGALGSKIAVEMARMGYLTQDLYDYDVLLPHNLIRHEATNKYLVGVNKAIALEIEIKCMYDNDITVQGFASDCFSITAETLNSGLLIDCTASERSLSWLCMNDDIKNRLIRSEISMDGRLGITYIEGRNRNPDAYDMRIALWYLATENEQIKQWLSKKSEANMEFHIGFGCSSDTMVLDDSTISNHASVVPHCINKYLSNENGTLVLNYFDKDELENNYIKIVEINKYIVWNIDDGWTVHCPCILVNQINKITSESTENMGIWFGYINERMKRITLVDTYMPSDNKRSAGQVIGGSDNVYEKIKQIAKDTGGLICYLGEWHTHPGGYAIPSKMDYKAFSMVSPNSKPFLMTIFSPNEVGNWILF